MKFKTLFLIFSLCILFSNCKNDTENPKEKIMLTNFYKAYINEISSSRDLKQMEKNLDSLKITYCTKSLIDSINIEFEKGLDYDPFINAQDADSKMLETLSVTNIENSKNKYIVKYKDNFSNTETKIYVIVIKENGQYKISSLK